LYSYWVEGIRGLDDYRKPRWWKRSVGSYWLIFVLLPFAVMLAVIGALYLRGAAALTDLLKYAVITSVAIAAAYYIRKTPLPGNVGRATWIMLGACGIGTLILVVMLGVFGKTLVHYLGPGLALLISFVTAIGGGALLGDFIGKRRGYLPLG
jgi:hypothetical protein